MRTPLRCAVYFCTFALLASVVAIWPQVSSPAQTPDSRQAPTPQSSTARPSSPPAAAVQSKAPAVSNAPTSRPAVAWRGAQVNHRSQREEMYFEGAWGVDDLRIKVAESGELIRFNYRVVDPQKATALNDKKAEPELLDAQAGVKLSVPQMEKVGKLRQSSTPKAGMSYWMAFSNPTLAVKRGHHVDVVIGAFRATNLLVE